MPILAALFANIPGTRQFQLNFFLPFCSLLQLFELRLRNPPVIFMCTFFHRLSCENSRSRARGTQNEWFSGAHNRNALSGWPSRVSL